jgi:hypothetical protein
VLHRVETIAAEIGSLLDQNWSDCCQKLTNAWKTSITGYPDHQQGRELAVLTEPLIVAGLQQAIASAERVGEMPAVSKSLGSLGTSALLTLRLHTVLPQLVLPAFVLSALWHLFSYVLGVLQHREGDYRTAISGRLARLGDRVGAEFEQEIRRRLSDLHQWRESAVRSVVEQRARELT